MEVETRKDMLSRWTKDPVFTHTPFHPPPIHFPSHLEWLNVQTRMVPSCDADIICLPFGKKATEGRLCLCPTSSTMLSWLEASQSLKPSLDPTQARYLPSAENANEETANPTLPNQWGVRLPVERLNSAESEASWVQSGEKATDEVEQVSFSSQLRHPRPGL